MIILSVAAIAITTLALLYSVGAFDCKDVVFVIVSQDEPYHAGLAAELKADIEGKALALNFTNYKPPTVYITSESPLYVEGAWRIVPLLRPLLELHSGAGAPTWFFFLEPHTAVGYEEIVVTLAAAARRPGPMWIGYPLTDLEPTILHHYYHFEEFSQDQDFTYPNFASGFAINMELLKTLVHQRESVREETDGEFSIDPAFELAQFVYWNQTNSGPLMSGELSFCPKAGYGCATFPKRYTVCGRPVPANEIFFAVKTSRYQSRGAQVVKDTWGAHATHLQFFSEKKDPSLPAVDLSVPDQVTGRCAKTVAILKYVTMKLKSMPQIKWVFLANDDTILSVKRLCEYLSCLRGGDAISMTGERYGYGYSNNKTTEGGVDYISAGGGTALSVAAAALLSLCNCSDPDAPDDLMLGACAKFEYELRLVHSPLFHQMPPQEYSRDYLARDRPVSFRIHWMLEPRRAYRGMFERDDITLRSGRVRHDHHEL